MRQTPESKTCPHVIESTAEDAAAMTPAAQPHGQCGQGVTGCRRSSPGNVFPNCRPAGFVLGDAGVPVAATIEGAVLGAGVMLERATRITQDLRLLQGRLLTIGTIAERSTDTRGASIGSTAIVKSSKIGRIHASHVGHDLRSTLQVGHVEIRPGLARGRSRAVTRTQGKIAARSILHQAVPHRNPRPTPFLAAAVNKGQVRRERDGGVVGVAKVDGDTIALAGVPDGKDADSRGDVGAKGGADGGAGSGASGGVSVGLLLLAQRGEGGGGGEMEACEEKEERGRKGEEGRGSEEVGHFGFGGLLKMKMTSCVDQRKICLCVMVI